MLALSTLANAAAVEAALGGLPGAYGAWTVDQAKLPLDTEEQRDIQRVLVARADETQARIAAGIALLQANAQARRVSS